MDRAMAQAVASAAGPFTIKKVKEHRKIESVNIPNTSGLQGRKMLKISIKKYIIKRH
jgi:hypothetical protein